MKTAVVGGLIVGVHCVVIGSVILMGGCGKTSSVAGPNQAPPPPDLSQVVMPPAEPVLTPPRVVSLPEEQMVTTPSQTMPVGPQTQTYTVKRGDMVSSIAQRCGVTTKELIKLNNLQRPDKIKIGQELLIPFGAKMKPAAPKTTPKPVVAGEGMQVYTVVKGDVLSRIAVRHGTTTKALMEKNELTGDKLKVGQKLVVPVVEREATPETPAVEPGVTSPEVVPPVPQTSEPATEELGATDSIAGSTAAPVAMGEPDVQFTYEVLPGDTLQSVAVKFNVSVERLTSINNLTSTDIKPSQVLKIPQAN